MSVGQRPSPTLQKTRHQNQEGREDGQSVKLDTHEHGDDRRDEISEATATLPGEEQRHVTRDACHEKHVHPRRLSVLDEAR